MEDILVYCKRNKCVHHKSVTAQMKKLVQSDGVRGGGSIKIS